MRICHFEVGPLATNVFVLSQGTDAVLVDTAPGAYEVVQPYLEEQDLQLSAILVTHGHWDHIAELSIFRKTGAKIYAHKGDAPLIQTPELMTRFMPEGIQIKGVTIDVLVADRQALTFLGEPCTVFSVPGHSPGSLAYYFPQSACAFVGDVLFFNSVGRSDLPGGSWNDLKNSIRSKLYTLPDNTVIYPGHGDFTSVQNEKTSNPFVRPV
ncbi:MAG: hypothetical protein A2Y14_04105 [Verrucomicrobia bacterium GWF2_51_19]|nr:MAG: hypothetical protein A2Y14_04105 [Verrucomicrobia bacterium GWF2_51_19]HCJ11793.1 MBL fold metallo-hydrolase [Opitutae bacterium]